MASKKLRAKIRKIGQAAANVVQYTAPLVGSALGPVGSAAGTAVAAAASTVGAKNKRAAIRRTVAYGASVTAGTAALGLISGSGIGAGSLTSLGSLFGAKTPSSSGALAAAQAKQDPMSAGAQVVPTTPDGGLNPADNLQRFGDFLGRATGKVNAAAAASGIPAAVDAGEEKPGIPPLLIAAGVVVAVMLTAKNAKK